MFDQKKIKRFCFVLLFCVLSLVSNVISTNSKDVMNYRRSVHKEARILTLTNQVNVEAVYFDEPNALQIANQIEFEGNKNNDTINNIHLIVLFFLLEQNFAILRFYKKKMQNMRAKVKLSHAVILRYLHDKDGQKSIACAI